MFSIPSPWPDFFVAVDQGLTSAVELHCVGGFVLTAVYKLPRTTGDLDYISITPQYLASPLEELAGVASPLAKKYRVYIQSAGGITDYPEDYETRVQVLPLELSKLTLKTLDPYDIVLSKLARNSPKDRWDVQFLSSQLGMEFHILYERWEKEMKPWIANAERHETTLNVVWKPYFKP